jgi:hypothetical protein
MTDISSKINHQKDIDILGSLLTDVTMLATRMDTLATKLNADAGVTDTNYVTTQVASITTTA